MGVESRSTVLDGAFSGRKKPYDCWERRKTGAEVPRESIGAHSWVVAKGLMHIGSARACRQQFYLRQANKHRLEEGAVSNE